MTITAVTDHGRLHLGYGDNAQGMGKSFRIHRDPITLLHAYLTANLVKVEINGKNYLANRNSFNKHLSSIGLKKVSLMTDRVVYTQLIKDKELKLSDETLGAGLSFEKRTELTSNLAKSIVANNIVEVKKWMRQGADLERRVYLYVYTSGLTFTSMNRPGMRYYRVVTPLTLALQQQHSNMANIISKMKKSDHSSDVYICYDTNGWNNPAFHKITHYQQVACEDNKLILKTAEDFD